MHTTVLDALKQHNDVASDSRPSNLVQVAMLSAKEGGGVASIKPHHFLAFQRKKRDLQSAEDSLLSAFLERDGVAEDNVKTKKPRTKRSCKNLRPYYVDDNGDFVFLKPAQTYWHLMCAKDSHCVLNVPKHIKKFRRRFRMPHVEFKRLLGECVASGHFNRWLRKDAVGNEPSPIGLPVLGALRYIGRGLTFDDLEEHTAIGEETHRQFFHRFIEHGEKVLFPKHVYCPRTEEEYSSHRSEFDTGGLTGAGFSSDGAHILLWNCSHNLRQAHVGFKMSHPARAYNLTTNHRRRILHTTKGAPGRWNDKTLSILDEFPSGLRKGKHLQDVTFELLEWTGAVGRSSLVRVRCRGAWGIVDGGHHKWSCMQAPAKVNVLISEQRFSDWIESFREDSECVFGILEGRFRLLKTGIRLHGVEAADRIWLTCCALHNRLLEIDGLSEPWTGALGENDAEEMRQHAPFAIQRLTETELRAFGSREHEPQARREDAASVSMLDDDAHDVVETPGNNPRHHEDGSVCVNSLSCDCFRSKLVQHYDILFRQHRIKWPTRK